MSIFISGKGRTPTKEILSFYIPPWQISKIAPSLEALDGRTLNSFFFTTKSEYGYESENSTPQDSDSNQ